MDHSHLKKILEEAANYFSPELEKTIFSIGGKGHYENPISDVLAFFLNPQEVHQFGTLFIDSLFDALGLSSSSRSLDMVTTPKREVLTESSKRIDILLEGEEWVLVIENKIYHHQSNPFHEYEKFASDNYAGKEAIFVILSPDGNSVSSEWRALSYKDFIRRVKNNIGNILVNSPFGKWMVLLREFIINIEQFAVRNSMDSKAIEFVENNIKDVYEVLRIKDSYINHVQNSGLNLLKSLFPEQEFSTTIHNWGNGPAIRYYSDSWGGKSNLVIQVSHEDGDSGIGIFFYVYDVDESDQDVVDQLLLKSHHKDPRTESRTIRRYQSENRYKHYEEFLPEFRETARDFNHFHRSRGE